MSDILDQARALVGAHRAARPYSHAGFIARAPHLVEALIAELEQSRRQIAAIEHDREVAASRCDDAEAGIRRLKGDLAIAWQLGKAAGGVPGLNISNPYKEGA